MARPSQTRAPNQLLSQWGEPRPLPGLAASAAQTLPRPLLYALAVLYAWSGLFGHDPWRGDDLLGIALAQSAFQALSHGQAFWLPQLQGVILSHQGPLPGLLTALLVWPVDQVVQVVQGRPLGSGQFDDVARAFLAISLAVGLYGLWHAIQRLALRREARPVDPLGIGPSAQALGQTLGDCGILLSLACLGALARWHEAGNATLSFALQAWLLWAVAAAPEQPHRAGRQIAWLLAALFLCDGLSGLISWAIGLLLVLWRVHAWRLVAAAMLRQIALHGAIVTGVLLLIVTFSHHGAAAQAWLAGQFSLRPQWPGAALRTWAWTWWPVWPMVLALAVQAYRHGLWHLEHLQMLSLVSAALVLVAFLGVSQAEASRLLPLAPLVALAVFGLLSLPRGLVSLIDWFAVVVFTALAALIWLYWSAMVSGFPAQLAQRLAFFAPELGRDKFSPLAFLVGTGISGAWLALVVWRVRRGQSRLWRPVVLSAGGVSLIWLLMLSLWGPALEINRGYRPLSQALGQAIAAARQAHPAAFSGADCIETDAQDQVSRALVLAYGLGRLGEPGQTCALHLQTIDRGPRPNESPPPGLVLEASRNSSRPQRERFQLVWSASLKKVVR